MTDFNQQSTAFNPQSIQEQLVKITVTAKEAHMIKIIRTVTYGEVVVKKANGEPIRVEKKETTLLKNEEGIGLA